MTVIVEENSMILYNIILHFCTCNVPVESLPRIKSYVEFSTNATVEQQKKKKHSNNIFNFIF